MTKPEIRVYRMTRHPDRDTIVFQGNSDAAKLFRRTFPLRVTQAREGYEGGYYTWLRFESRQGLWSPIRQFLQRYYVAPEIRLNRFACSKPLSDTWPAKVWLSKLVEGVKVAFSDHVIEENVDGWQAAYGHRPVFEYDNVSIYRGMRFKIEIDEEFRPVLFCEVKHKAHLDDQPVSLETIAQRLADNEDLMRQIRAITTRSAAAHFDAYRWFVQRLGVLSGCENIEFLADPLPARALGYETWFWLHDTETQIEIGNSIETDLPQVLLSEGGGFYNQPDDIQVLLLLPDENSNPDVPHVEWSRVTSLLQDYLRRALPQTETPFVSLQYLLAENHDATLDSVKGFVDQYPDRRLLTLMIIPEKSRSATQSETEIAAEASSWKVQKSIRDLAWDGYVINLGWGCLTKPDELPYFVNNAVTRGLYQVGARPWRLVRPPVGDDNPEEVMFIGLASDSWTSQLAGVAFGSDGTIIGYCGLYTQSSKGDFGAMVGRVVGQLIALQRSKAGIPAKRVVVHVPLSLGDTAEQLAKTLEKCELNCDAVSISFDGGPRLCQVGNEENTPSKGIAIGNGEIAYLINTYTVKEKLVTGEWILPAPNSVVVQRVAGTMSMRLLAAQIYWFSTMHINAVHRTVDAPMTLDIADRLRQHLAKSKRNMPPTSADDKVMFWL